jgi:hypothetical protein
MSGMGRRAVWLYVVDVLMVVASLVMTLSWVLLWFVFPRGFYPAREAWLVVHKYAGLVLTLLVAVHGGLHWRWLVRMTGRVLRGRQT